MKHEKIMTNLAKQRNREAAERTMLAWLRTSLSLIGFGFGIPGISDFLIHSKLETLQHLSRNVRIFGISFIILGLIGIAIAMVQYRKELRRIRLDDYAYEETFPLAFFVAGLLFVIGVFAFAVLIF